MELACSRTTMEFESAWITSTFSQPGFTGAVEDFTTIGADMFCARDGRAAQKATSARTTRPRALYVWSLDVFIEGDLQRLEKLDVLRGNFNLGVGFLFLEDFLIDADVQRFKKAAVLRCHLGIR